MAKSDNTAIAVAAQKFLKYYPKTGCFAWIAGRLSGRVAGSQSGKRYWYIQFRGHKFPAHRLAWFFENGEWPDGDIDHINGDKQDNRIANLRPASRSENLWNSKKRKDNKTGEKNVFWLARDNKWLVRVHANGKSHLIGRFAPDHYDQAVLAARKARANLHKEFCRHK